VAVEIGDQFGVDVRGDFPVVGNLADLPETLDRRRRRRQRADVGIG
jgi:hypothetical protein